MLRWLRSLFGLAGGGTIPAPPGGRDTVPVMLSPGGEIADPDEAESLGLTVDARRMREGRGGG